MPPFRVMGWDADFQTWLRYSAHETYDSARVAHNEAVARGWYAWVATISVGGTGVRVVRTNAPALLNPSVFRSEVHGQ